MGVQLMVAGAVVEVIERRRHQTGDIDLYISSAWNCAIASPLAPGLKLGTRSAIRPSTDLCAEKASPSGSPVIGS